MIRTKLSVPECSPLFDGHFDGNPVLSGVSQLYLIEKLLQQHLPGVTLQQVPRLRFKATAGPRDVLLFELSSPDATGNIRVSLSRGEQSILNGVLRVDQGT